jgi:hypothetical protein
MFYLELGFRNNGFFKSQDFREFFKNISLVNNVRL